MCAGQLNIGLCKPSPESGDSGLLPMGRSIRNLDRKCNNRELFLNPTATKPF